MRSFCEQTGVLPCRTSLIEQELDFAVRPDLMPVFVSQATTLSPELVRAVTVPGFTKVNTAFQDELEAYIVSGKSADDALAAMATAATEGLQA
jgi:multiple sugar transport system substrate-binding protein